MSKIALFTALAVLIVLAVGPAVFLPLKALWNWGKKPILVACGVLVFMRPELVFAATPSTAISSDAATFWWNLIVAVAQISVPVAIGLVALWYKAHFKIAAGSNAANIIDLLVAAGKQFTLGAIAKAPTTAAAIDVKNAAIAEFLNELSSSTQQAMKLKGVTTDSIAQRINGEIALVLGVPAVPAAPAPAQAKVSPA